eukprot:151558-Rhodomonas_salina.2
MEFLDDSMTLVVSVRGDNYLHYIDIDTGDVNKANLNALGDDHVSFTVRDSTSANCQRDQTMQSKTRLLLLRSDADVPFLVLCVRWVPTETLACWFGVFVGVWHFGWRPS